MFPNTTYLTRSSLQLNTIDKICLPTIRKKGGNIIRNAHPSKWPGSTFEHQSLLQPFATSSELNIQYFQEDFHDKCSSCFAICWLISWYTNRLVSFAMARQWDSTSLIAAGKESFQARLQCHDYFLVDSKGTYLALDLAVTWGLSMFTGTRNSSRTERYLSQQETK